MNILRKIRLSGEYGTALYAVSGVVTLAAAALVVGSPSSISLCVLLKSLSVPVILYLFHSFRKEGTIYFYINLGISRNEFFLMPIVVEFVAFVLIMIYCCPLKVSEQRDIHPQCCCNGIADDFSEGKPLS